MTKQIDTNELLEILEEDCITDTKILEAVRDIVKRQSAGEKIVTKIRFTKNASYLNVYVYDKTSWRYLLESSEKIELGR